MKLQFFALLILLLSLVSCNSIRKDKLEEQLKTARQIAGDINTDFEKVREQVTLFAASTQKAYESKAAILPTIDKSAYATAENGCFYKKKEDGKSALWVSGYYPITQDVKEVAYFTEAIDTSMERIIKVMPEVVQAYFNDKSSLNRIYPWFDVLAQYQPKMDIPKFNFYYLADAKHNPERKSVWVNEPYVDPAGRGWMVSAIAPVYQNDVLEGVCGLDVTISTITDRYVDKINNISAIFARSGVLVASSEKAIPLMGMPVFKEHKYIETIKENTFKADDYNLLKTRIHEVRNMAEAFFTRGEEQFVLKSGTQEFQVVACSIKELDWILLLFVPIE